MVAKYLHGRHVVKLLASKFLFLPFTDASSNDITIEKKNYVP